MTTPSLPQTRRDRILVWVAFLCILPGLLLLLISFTRSIFSDSAALLSPVNRLGFALVAAGLWLSMATLELLRRLSPSWRAVLAEREGIGVRHPRRLRLAGWWCASVGALAFVLLAIAPDPLAAWLSAGSPFNSLALFTYVYSALAIACVPVLLLYRFERPR